MGTSVTMGLDTKRQSTATDEPLAQETTTTAGGETTVTETPNVTFTNQTSNGSLVVVDRVVVPEGGFVAIHAAENVSREDPAENETELEGVTQTETTVMDGEIAQQYAAREVLGNSTYLEPGVHENVTVPLNESLSTRLAEQEFLIAMPHRDTNDNQQYDFPEADDPYTRDDQPVTELASITLEATANQTTTVGTETTTEEM